MGGELLETKIDGRVGVLTFNRADVLNAFNSALIGEVGRALGPNGATYMLGGLAYDPPSAEALRGAWGGRLNRSLLIRTARDLAGRLAAPLTTGAATPAGRR